jgi:hypothetical protein
MCMEEPSGVSIPERLHETMPKAGVQLHTAIVALCAVRRTTSRSLPIMEVPMDSLTSIVTALAAGAAAALQLTAEQVVKDSYAALKGLIQRKYRRVNTDLRGRDPTSEGRRVVV